MLQLESVLDSRILAVSPFFAVFSLIFIIHKLYQRGLTLKMKLLLITTGCFFVSPCHFLAQVVLIEPSLSIFRFFYICMRIFKVFKTL